MELQALEAALPQLAALGARLLANSPQLPVNSRRSLRENGLTFPKVRLRLPDTLVEVYRGFGNELPVVKAVRAGRSRCRRASWSDRTG